MATSFFSEITSPQAQKFIKEHLQSPVEELLLSSKKFPKLNVPLLVTQIEGRNKAKSKLPSWFGRDEMVYPAKLSMEQCSSEVTAAYKASLLSGNLLIDLTGGLGIDTAAFSERMAKVIYIERTIELAEIARHNFEVLQKTNIEIQALEAETFLSNCQTRADWIYIDPARRKEGSKVFRFEDCEPDVLQLQQKLFSISDQLLLKTSPLLDIDQAVKVLGYVKEVHVLAVENECKELLFMLDKNVGKEEPELVAINFKKERVIDKFRFTRTLERVAEVNLSAPLEYLYEPNAALMKAGAFKSIASAKGLSKLHASSHLYTSAAFQQDFPGRIFRLLKVLKYSKKEIIAEIPEGKANVTARNFPETVAEIRKKTGLKDGGKVYLFATTDLHHKPVVLLTEKLN